MFFYRLVDENLVPYRPCQFLHSGLAFYLGLVGVFSSLAMSFPRLLQFLPFIFQDTIPICCIPAPKLALSKYVLMPVFRLFLHRVQPGGFPAGIFQCFPHHSFSGRIPRCPYRGRNCPYIPRPACG